MFERGFKSWCERRAVETRKALCLKEHESLDPRALAERLGIDVWDPKCIPRLSQRANNLLLKPPGNSTWSAVTLVEGDRTVIILNSSHSSGRQSNDLMHEIAHIELGHLPDIIEIGAQGIALRHNYNKQQEQEADWLAACLLLPRPALVRIKRARIELLEAAKSYGVSQAMLRYRLAITGVNAQFSS
jgi:Zn-dependent peptidase ImmA (M78 family)